MRKIFFTNAEKLFISKGIELGLLIPNFVLAIYLAISMPKNTNKNNR